MCACVFACVPCCAAKVSSRTAGSQHLSSVQSCVANAVWSPPVVSSGWSRLTISDDLSHCSASSAITGPGFVRQTQLQEWQSLCMDIINSCFHPPNIASRFWATYRWCEWHVGQDTVDIPGAVSRNMRTLYLPTYHLLEAISLGTSELMMYATLRGVQLLKMSDSVLTTSRIPSPQPTVNCPDMRHQLWHVYHSFVRLCLWFSPIQQQMWRASILPSLIPSTIGSTETFVFPPIPCYIQ